VFPEGGRFDSAGRSCHDIRTGCNRGAERAGDDTLAGQPWKLRPGGGTPRLPCLLHSSSSLLSYGSLALFHSSSPAVAAICGGRASYSTAARPLLCLSGGEEKVPPACRCCLPLQACRVEHQATIRLRLSQPHTVLGRSAQRSDRA